MRSLFFLGAQTDTCSSEGSCVACASGKYTTGNGAEVGGCTSTCTVCAAYQVSAPKNTRLFLESIDFDAWGDPYGNWGMGTLLAPPLVPIRSPPRVPPSRHRR